MPVFQHLLQRLGFVKLTRYGLELSPEGRIVSCHPGVVADALGRQIVGWTPEDPIGSEAARVAAAAAPRAELRSAPLATPATVPVAAPQAAGIQADSSPTDVGGHDAVALPPTVDEDDWEWMIALARARAASDPAPEQVSAPRTVQPAPAAPAVSPRTRTQPMATIALRDPTSSSEWPATVPLGAIEYDQARTTRPMLAATAPPVAAVPRTVTPSTVIPVPALPTVDSAAMARRLEPVVRTTPRLAKGTQTEPPPPAAVDVSDDTVQTLSVGDRTTPGIALPPAARAVQLPSIKRRAALSR